NNIVYPGPFGSEDGALLFPYPNQRPDAPPEQRFLAPGARVKRTNQGEQIRLFLFASPDRVHWSQVGDKAIINGLGTEDPSTFYPPENLLDSDHSLFWDAPSKQYFLYLRDQRVQPTTAERLRAVRRSTSRDLVNWTYPQWTHMRPSPPDQFYTFGARPYFRAPHFYLAFPMRYTRWRNAQLPAKYKKQLGVGVSDTVFVSSRDGLHWDRRFLDGFIRPGLDPLKWTDRSNHTSMGLVPTGPNEMSVYTLEYFRLPVPRVRRYVMRTDGIASINASYTGGQLTTKPLVFSGNRLLINASTSAVGGIRVEILDASGKGIDRFTGDNIIEFFGDSVEQEIRWDQGPDVGSLAGKPVRLRFRMKDADLYSFRFRNVKTVSSVRRPSKAVEEPEPTAVEGHRAVHFTEQLIWDGFIYNWGVQAVDIDADGFVDLTVSDARQGELKAEPFAGEAGQPTRGGGLSNLYWFKNDGKGNFQRRFIAENAAHGRLERHVIADVNNDGHPDVVIVDNFYSDLLWYEHPGEKAVARGDRWKKHFLTKGGMLGAEDVTVADFDGDSNLDVAAAGWRLGNHFKWFRNPGPADQKAEWSGYHIDGGFPVTRSIVTGDVNGDGRPDLLATSDAARIILWYENTRTGTEDQVVWRRHVVDLPVGRPVFGRLVDLDRDDDLDILMPFGGWTPTISSEVAWYENTGPKADGRIPWKRHIITEDFPAGHEATTADLDGDGDLDVIATGHRPGRVAWFENPGNPTARWRKHLLKDNWPNANQVIIADLNNDGRDDIVTCADVDSRELRWWRNDGQAAQ
ncbi:MAG: VCBS repeat-containing protein, partial [Deltaproteobacteria bacterium]|nr:VCBS repeat-containing protein [Deltaproteobacteria bacterium]